MMKVRALASTAALSISVFAAPAAFAHEEDDVNQPPKRTRAPTYDPKEYRSDQYGALEFRVGPYRPRVDDEFGGGATPFEDLFGTGQSVSFGLEGDFQFFRIPHFGSLAVGLGWNFVHYGADSLSAANPDERIPHPTSLWIMPMYGVGVLRVDVLSRDFDIPIVPYVKGGLGVAVWKSEDAGSLSTVNGLTARNIEIGPQFMVGGMLHLNFFAPQAALDMDNSTGVNHAYLFGEYLFSDLDSFDQGMQVGASTWQVGVAIEY